MAQSEACFCSSQWTNYWLHTGRVNCDRYSSLRVFLIFERSLVLLYSWGNVLANFLDGEGRPTVCLDFAFRIYGPLIIIPWKVIYCVISNKAYSTQRMEFISESGEIWDKIAKCPNIFSPTGTLHLKDDVSKMSKSLKNTVAVSDLLQKYTANQFRLFCMLRPYRQSEWRNQTV